MLTRRVIDVATMQAHLLLVSSVYDQGVSPAFDNRNMIGEFRAAVRVLDPQKFARIMVGDPDTAQYVASLRTKITANKAILKLLQGSGISPN